MKRSSRIKSLIVGLAALGLAGVATAQQLEEIIVTATHREENLQTVPISVTALSAETLEKADIFRPPPLRRVSTNLPAMVYHRAA